MVASLKAAHGAHEHACRVPWQGKRVVTIAYTQEKRVAGALFRSPQDGFWDQKVCRSLAVASPPHAQSAGTTERDGATHAALPSHVIDPKLLLSHYKLRAYLYSPQVLDPQFHKLLSNLATQQLLCNRLAEDGLKPIIKALSINANAGRQVRGLHLTLHPGPTPWPTRSPYGLH